MPKENLKWESHYNQKSVIAKLWRETLAATAKVAAKNPSPHFRVRFYTRERIEQNSFRGKQKDPTKTMRDVLKCGAELSQIDLDYEPKGKA